MSAAMQNPFADCVTKILNSNKNRKKCILAKALKDKDVEERKSKKVCIREEPQYVDSDGNEKTDERDSEAVEESHVDSEPECSTVEITAPVKKKEKRTDSDILAKKKPEFNDRERELNAIATKGVIHLFNTVRQQQQTIEANLKKAGPSERKKDKVLSKFTKSKFLDKLKESDKSEPKSDGWKVLKDDFLSDAKMKDWDNEEDDTSHSEDI